jgi:hypothetical protein
MWKTDVKWLLMVLAAVALFSIFGLPYFTRLGHPWWSILVYAFFTVIFLYGRCNRPPKHSSEDRHLR